MLTRHHPLGTVLKTYDGLEGVVVDQSDPAYIVLEVASGARVKVGRLTIDRDYYVTKEVE
jgi:ribosomal protein L21E